MARCIEGGAAGMLSLFESIGGKIAGFAGGEWSVSLVPFGGELLCLGKLFEGLAADMPSLS